jgi:hypothetical protein
VVVVGRIRRLVRVRSTGRVASRQGLLVRESPDTQHVVEADTRELFAVRRERHFGQGDFLGWRHELESLHSGSRIQDPDFTSDQHGQLCTHRTEDRSDDGEVSDA